ncbi:dihydroneopterin aldolase [Ostreibacterium oceani]|uniref:dihydroneopterin aldolase n=1 Tax=Ostreibacterium oceani TaxID=2654998 RepID=A0A6N7EV71_9GAMM|nr:dihydroneopterin aldolase [Ostreibacterium oceani]MPV86461.1 FolB domain-containing protein [Ostreibacterium oceani]
MTDIIFIDNIPTQSVIGIHDFEKAAPQKLIISVQLETCIRAAAASDSIKDALDYDAISRFIDTFARRTNVQLLESFAERLVAELFANFALTGVHLRIQKPGAITLTQQVGVAIYRKAN